MINGNLVPVLVLFVASAFGARADVKWVKMRNGDPLPANALLGGYERASKPPNDGAPQYVCRVEHHGIQPGKLLKGLCNVGWGGREIEFSEYEVAVTTGGSWGVPHVGFEGALNGGTENGGPLYVCRVPSFQYEREGFQMGLPGFRSTEDRGTHLGKVVLGACHFGFGGKEKPISQFEVYYPAGEGVN